MENKHTPTPWFVENKFGQIFIMSKKLKIALICESGMGQTTEDRANAKFIVDACNKYDNFIKGEKDGKITNDS